MKEKENKIIFYLTKLLKKNARHKSKNLSKSLSIIYGLQTSLDFDKALEIANNLFQLYEYCRHEIIKDLVKKLKMGLSKLLML